MNTLEDLRYFLNDNKIKRIFLLCGNKSFPNSGAKKFLSEHLRNKEINFFYKESEFPELSELIKIIDRIRIFKPDLILAVGGGTIIDYAKIANLVENKINLKDLIINYSYPFKKKFTKLVVIPTTAGSGAEVTSNAVIYVDKTKHSFESDLLIPDNFFLIPEFLISAPEKIKASAGFDSIAQALESLISQKSNEKSVEYATKSLNISLKNYISFLKDPNLKNSSEMSIAANLAGKAINISKTTLPHAASYPFTALFNISHGQAVSLFFEKFFKFNYVNLSKSEAKFDLKKRYELIFKLFDVKNIDEFNQKIFDIKIKAKLENDLDKLNIDIKTHSEKIINGINFLRLKNNPVKIMQNEIYEIISSK
jgi:alcohol dehydrogenase class IV